MSDELHSMGEFSGLEDFAYRCIYCGTRFQDQEHPCCRGIYPIRATDEPTVPCACCSARVSPDDIRHDDYGVPYCPDCAAQSRKDSPAGWVGGWA